MLPSQGILVNDAVDLDATSTSRGRFARGLHANFSTSPRRGERGDTGARCTAFVCKSVRKRRTRAYRFSGEHPASQRKALTAYAVISSATKSFCQPSLPVEAETIRVWIISPQTAWHQQRYAGTTRFAVRSPPKQSHQTNRYSPPKLAKADLAVVCAPRIASTETRPATTWRLRCEST